MLVLLLFLTAFNCIGEIGDISDLNKFISESNLICVGSPVKLYIENRKDKEGKSWSITEISIDHLIKGEIPSKTINIGTEKIDVETLPEDIRKNLEQNAEEALSAVKDARWLLFLMQVDGRDDLYLLTDKYNSIVTVSSSKPSGLDEKLAIAEHIEKELLGMLESTNKAEYTSACILLHDWGRKSDEIMTALRKASESKDIQLKGNAIGVRIVLGDKTAITDAIEYQPSEGKPSLIGDSISKINNFEMIPDLGKCFSSRNISVRKGAAEALRRMANEDTEELIKPIMIKCLDDPDRSVQYHAIMTLGTLAYKHYEQEGDIVSDEAEAICEAMPGLELFNKEPDEYVNEWKKMLSRQNSKSEKKD